LLRGAVRNWSAMASYSECEGLGGIGDRFGTFVHRRGFPYYGLYLYTGWTGSDCPDVTLTNISVIDQPGHLAKMAPVLAPPQVNEYQDGGIFWWSNPANDDAPVLVLPYRGADRECALVTLIPGTLRSEADDEIVRTGREFYDQASKSLREQGVIPEKPTLSDGEITALTVKAEGTVTSAVLSSRGLTGDSYNYYLEGAIEKLRARNILHAVVIALRLGLIAPQI